MSVMQCPLYCFYFILFYFCTAAATHFEQLESYYFQVGTKLWYQCNVSDAQVVRFVNTVSDNDCPSLLDPRVGGTPDLGSKPPLDCSTGSERLFTEVPG